MPLTTMNAQGQLNHVWLLGPGKNCVETFALDGSRAHKLTFKGSSKPMKQIFIYTKVILEQLCQTLWQTRYEQQQHKNHLYLKLNLDKATQKLNIQKITRDTCSNIDNRLIIMEHKEDQIIRTASMNNTPLLVGHTIRGLHIMQHCNVAEYDTPCQDIITTTLLNVYP